MMDRRRREQQVIDECRLLLSHEMRSPLIVLERFAQQMLDRYATARPEDGARLLERMADASRLLAGQVEGMIELIDVARRPMLVRSVDVSALCEEVCAAARARAAGRDVEVQVESGMACEGDADLIRLVVAKLVDNAFKFTARVPHARVRIGTRAPSRKGAAGEFFVADNGAGFDPRMSHKLFQAFGRLHSVTEFTGTGLGLAIARHAVERHGGRIEADGKPGEGSTFRFTIRRPNGAATRRGTAGGD